MATVYSFSQPADRYTATYTVLVAHPFAQWSREIWEAGGDHLGYILALSAGSWQCRLGVSGPYGLQAVRGFDAEWKVRGWDRGAGVMVRVMTCGYDEPNESRIHPWIDAACTILGKGWNRIRWPCCSHSGPSAAAPKLVSGIRLKQALPSAREYFAGRASHGMFRVAWRIMSWASNAY